MGMKKLIQELNAVTQPLRDIALVVRAIDPGNKLRVKGDRLRVLRIGAMVLVYDPKRFYGTTIRNLLWLVKGTTAYALNAPSKMVTPSLKWPREDGVEVSTVDLVREVFG